MTYNVLILGASYGSLLGTKVAAGGHNVTFVCRQETATLINSKGTDVRIKLKNETTHRKFFSDSLRGNVNAVTPEQANPEHFDLICLAMQEPQYSHPTIKNLMNQIAQSNRPCMSIMNMPPLPFLKRIKNLDTTQLKTAFLNPQIWDNFDPNLMTLCSPDPQAFRPPESLPNVLHVGLPTNFKVSSFDNPNLNQILINLANDIELFRIEEHEVPVKLKVFDSLFVPLAKWAMLATGNYRCVTKDGAQSIRDAVHTDIKKSEQIYEHINGLVLKLGAKPEDLVPFEKYANAAKNLLKPSSAARSVYLGASNIERVDKLIKLIAETIGHKNHEIEEAVSIIDEKLANNSLRTG